MISCLSPHPTLRDFATDSSHLDTIRPSKTELQEESSEQRRHKKAPEPRQQTTSWNSQQQTHQNKNLPHLQTRHQRRYKHVHQRKKIFKSRAKILTIEDTNGSFVGQRELKLRFRVQGLGFSGPHSTAGYRSHLSPLLLTAASRDRYAVKGEVGGREKGGRERTTPWCLLQVAKDEDASECAEVRGGERKM
jgi:hypothetical protein